MHVQLNDCLLLRRQMNVCDHLHMRHYHSIHLFKPFTPHYFKNIRVALMKDNVNISDVGAVNEFSSESIV